MMRLLRGVKHKGVKYDAGLRGEVFWSGSYGHFYRNGYNKPDRENTRVGLRLTTGEKIFVALSALRLDREPMLDGELMVRAHQAAKSHCWRAVGAIHGMTRL
jgi:hypothetical protein